MVQKENGSVLLLQNSRDSQIVVCNKNKNTKCTPRNFNNELSKVEVFHYASKA